MPEVRANIDKELYKMLEKRKEETGKTIKELVIEAIKNYLQGISGDITQLMGKITSKIIYVKHKTKCINCGNVIEENQRALWIKGIGCICVKCLFKEALKKFTDKDYIREITKLELEIQRLKAIKGELRKEIKELAIKYYTFEPLQILEEIKETVNKIDDFIMNFMGEFIKEEEFKKEMKNMIRKLDKIIERIEYKTIPRSWIEKLVKEYLEDKEEKHKIELKIRK